MTGIQRLRAALKAAAWHDEYIRVRQEDLRAIVEVFEALVGPTEIEEDPATPCEKDGGFSQ